MKRNKKGFTIVELVIVIGVIGILSAILIPTFVSLNEQAQNAQLQSNLHNAFSMYAADAADGKYGDATESDVNLEQKDQNKVYISDKATWGAEGAKVYSYENGKWGTPTSTPSSATAVTTATEYVTNGYLGFYIYY